MIDEPLDGRLFGKDQPCFGCGPEHPIGFRLTFEREGEEVVTRFTPGQRFQGPPGIMHGGLVMALADEIGAWTVLGALGKFGFTASIDGRLARPVRVGEEVMGRGRVSKSGRRVVETSVRILQGGEDAFTATLKFVLLDESGAQRLLGTEIPEAWKRFSRD